MQLIIFQFNWKNNIIKRWPPPRWNPWLQRIKVEGRSKKKKNSARIRRKIAEKVFRKICQSYSGSKKWTRPVITGYGETRVVCIHNIQERWRHTEIRQTSPAAYLYPIWNVTEGCHVIQYEGKYIGNRSESNDGIAFALVTEEN